MSSSVVAEAVEKTEDALANAFSTSHYYTKSTTVVKVMFEVARRTNGDRLWKTRNITECGNFGTFLPLQRFYVESILGDEKR